MCHEFPFNRYALLLRRSVEKEHVSKNMQDRYQSICCRQTAILWFQTAGQDFIQLSDGKNLRYECTYCNQHYTKLHSLRRHQTAKHGRKKRWTKSHAIQFPSNFCSDSSAAMPSNLNSLGVSCRGVSSNDHSGVDNTENTGYNAAENEDPTVTQEKINHPTDF